MTTAIQSSGSTTVDRLADIQLTGNIIPHSWYKSITFKNGKPDSVAITVLSEIVYWYRPKEIFDETSGEVTGYRKKFKYDKLQLSYQQLADKFGYTKTQIKSAITTLCDLGIVQKELRNIYAAGQTLSNVMFLDLDVDKLLEVTIYKDGPSEDRIDTLPDSNHRPLPLKPETYTKTTTKITTKTATDTSSICQEVEKDEKYNQYKKMIKENIEYNGLMESLDSSAQQMLSEIIDLMLELIMTNKETIRIRSRDMPVSIVKSVYLKLTKKDSCIRSAQNNF